MNSMHKSGLQQHRRVRSLGGMSHIIQTERDEDLALFHEMQEREMAEVTSSAAQESPSSLMDPRKKLVAEDIFSSTEWDKNDYGWLLTAPSMPNFSNLEQEAVGNRCSVNGRPSAKSSLKTSRTQILRSEPSSRGEPVSRIAHGILGTNQLANSMNALRSSMNSGPLKSLSSSTSATLRPSTPTSNGRPASPKPQPAARSSTTTRAMGVPSVSKSGSLTTSVRPSTPTGRSAMISSARAASFSRPSLVQSASTSLPTQPVRSSSTSTSMASTRPGGSMSRASTPVKRPVTPTRTADPPSTITQSSTVPKRSASPQPKMAASSRPSSPASRARQPAAHPAVLPGFSQEPPPNLRTSIPERPLSNSRGSVASRASGGRPTQPAEINDGAQRLRASGSPLVTRGRLSSDSINSEKSLTRLKAHDALQTALSNGIQSKMMDRTGPTKKALVVPEKPSVMASPQEKISAKPSPMRNVKSTSPSVRESTGFGRNLSKKSLDMALRHMDIGKNPPTSFKTFMSNVHTSSLYSVRSSNGRGRSSSSIADSPVATSSNASSEHSMNFATDRECSEAGDEIQCETGSKASLIRHPEFYDEKKVNSWLGSPTPIHDVETRTDILHVFEQGLERLSTCDSPLVNHIEGGLDCKNFALEPIQ